MRALQGQAAAAVQRPQTVEGGRPHTAISTTSCEVGPGLAARRRARCLAGAGQPTVEQPARKTTGSSHRRSRRRRSAAQRCHRAGGSGAPDIYTRPARRQCGTRSARRPKRRRSSSNSERFAYKSLFKGVSVPAAQPQRRRSKLEGIAERQQRSTPAHYYTVSARADHRRIPESRNRDPDDRRGSRPAGRMDGQGRQGRDHGTGIDFDHRTRRSLLTRLFPAAVAGGLRL